MKLLKLLAIPFINGAIWILNRLTARMRRARTTAFWRKKTLDSREVFIRNWNRPVFVNRYPRPDESFHDFLKNVKDEQEPKL